MHWDVSGGKCKVQSGRSSIQLQQFLQFRGDGPGQQVLASKAFAPNLT